MKQLDLYILEKLHLKKGIQRDIEYDELYAVWVDDAGFIHSIMTWKFKLLPKFKEYINREWGRKGINDIKFFIDKNQAAKYRKELENKR